MTQEEKDLLSKDICGRMPYGVKIETEYFTKATLISIRKNISYGVCKDLLVTYDISNEETPFQTDERSSTISKIKPYLFPLSSMTEEQKEEIEDKLIFPNNSDGGWMEILYNNKYEIPFWFVDFCNKNHLDYRGLIPMGLAINATGLDIY